MSIRVRQISDWLVAAISVLLAAGVVVPSGVAADPPTGPLQLIRTITLPDLAGRIDHLAIDLKGRRLFLAALEMNTIEVIDLKSGKVSRSLTGFNKPQGVFYLARLNRLFVASGKDGAVRSFDGPTAYPFRERERFTRRRRDWLRSNTKPDLCRLRRQRRWQGSRRPYDF